VNISRIALWGKSKDEVQVEEQGSGVCETAGVGGRAVLQGRVTAIEIIGV
jgi:hypothetical protein